MTGLALLSLFLVALVVEPADFARLSGHGAIIVHDYAPVYQLSTGGATVMTLMRGDAVARPDCGAVLGSFAEVDGFRESDGRLRVMYLAGSPTGARRYGWMDPQDLEPFAYSGSCAAGAGPFSEDYFDNPLGHMPPHR